MSQALVVGAGPAGLAAAAALKRLGAAFVLLDRAGEPGGAYREISPSMRLASPTRTTALPGPEPVSGDEYVTAAQYLDYLRRYAAREGLEARRGELRALRPEGAGWSAEVEPASAERFASVIVATGMFHAPRWPSLPGLDALRAPGGPAAHSKAFAAPPAGSRVLVIGAGTSAVEAAEACAAAGSRVVVSSRSGKVRAVPKALFGHDLHDYVALIERLPRLFFHDFCRRRPTILATDLGFSRHVEAGRVRVRGPIVRLDERRAVFAEGPPEPFDLLVCATGYSHAMPFLPPAVACIDRGGDAPRTSADGESTSHPGLFFVGTPCARGGASEFLRGIARDAPEVARAAAARL